MPDPKIDMTARERQLFEACSKEALFALVRSYAVYYYATDLASLDWVQGAALRLDMLAEAGKVPAKFANVLSKRPKRHVAGMRGRKRTSPAQA